MLSPSPISAPLTFRRDVTTPSTQPSTHPSTPESAERDGKHSVSERLLDEQADSLESGTLRPVATAPATGMTVTGGGHTIPPLHVPLPPGRCDTAKTVLKVAGIKMVGQVLSAGTGELVASGVRIGFNALIILPGGRGAIAAVAVGGAIVGVTGLFIGKQAAGILKRACGTSGCIEKLLTMPPVIAPLLTAALAGGGLWEAAARLLSETVCRRVASGVRDTLNEFGSGALPDVQYVGPDGLDNDDLVPFRWGAVGQVIPNVGIAALGQYLLPVELDGATGYALPFADWVKASSTSQFLSGLGGAAASAVIKGGWAFGIEVSNGLSARLSGGGLREKKGEGLRALQENLRDAKTTWRRVADHWAMRSYMQTFSADPFGAVPRSISGPASHGVSAVASVMQAVGESRSYFVKAGQRTQQPVQAEAQEGVELADLTEVATVTPEDFKGPPRLQAQAFEAPASLQAGEPASEPACE
jgi:hypothetical protein